MLSKDMYVLLHGSIFLKNESLLNCSKGEKKIQSASRIDFTLGLLVTPIHTSAIFFPWEKMQKNSLRFLDVLLTPY